MCLSLSVIGWLCCTMCTFKAYEVIISYVHSGRHCMQRSLVSLVIIVLLVEIFTSINFRLHQRSTWWHITQPFYVEYKLLKGHRTTIYNENHPHFNETYRWIGWLVICCRRKHLRTNDTFFRLTALPVTTSVKALNLTEVSLKHWPQSNKITHNTPVLREDTLLLLWWLSNAATE